MNRGNLSDRWWESSSGLIGFSLKPRKLMIRDLIEKVDDIESWGFDVLSMGVPYHGGIQYSGLDVVDYYSVDPAIGTMDDLHALIGKCHDRGIAVIASFNLGYASMEYPPFLKACDDVRVAADTPEAHWFLWSDSRFEELDRNGLPFFRNDLKGNWCFNHRAGKYYWVSWKGEYREVDMPQFNFGNAQWRKECEKVICFWMDTGIDGMVVDAVNWYLNCTWEINNAVITGPIHRYPNSFVQPEGAGGFKDDPVPWITQGQYDSVQDYELATWWTGHNVIRKAIQNSNPERIEWALRAFRDRVVDAGGVTWLYPEWARGLDTGLDPSQMLLETAVIATVGEILVLRDAVFHLPWAGELRDSLRELVQLRKRYPALRAPGSRKKLPTNNDALYYAFLRSSVDAKQQILVVLNFLPRHRLVSVYLEKPASLKDVRTGERLMADAQVEMPLSPYGYRIFSVEKI